MFVRRDPTVAPIRLPQLLINFCMDDTAPRSLPDYIKSQSSIYENPTKVNNCLDIDVIILQPNPLLCNTSKPTELRAVHMLGPAVLSCLSS